LVREIILRGDCYQRSNSDRSLKAERESDCGGRRGPAGGFKGKLIVGKRAVRCWFVCEASYLTAGPTSAYCDPPDLVTIFLVYASDAQHFDVRKALASGGALEVSSPCAISITPACGQI